MHDARPPRPPTDDAAPPPATCTETHDQLALSVNGMGHADACPTGAASGMVEYDVTGALATIDAQSFQIDTCSPTADCTPMLVTFTLRAPGLDLRTLPKGSYVTAHLRFTHSWACTSSIVLTSVADWYGVKNPVDGGGHTYFVASDGNLDAAGSPFKVERVALGCKPGAPSCGGGAPDDYRLQFIAPSMSLEVPMGETRFPIVLAPGETLTVRNLRSYVSGACDDSWNWAYWAVRSETLGV
ncbi:MAG: hypothetical protein NVSMB47_05500 [Polyangiales bacterium]